MNYLIYLLFGKDNNTFKSELVYSLLSFNLIAGEWSKKNTQILIYSPETFYLPECLSALNISFNLLMEEDIDSCIKKANGHSLVLKARVLYDFLQQYQSPGILIDTDTFFIRDPQPVFDRIRKGFLLLHLKEYLLDKRPGIYSFFQKKTFKKLNGDSFSVPPDLHMWNSGAIGCHPQYTGLLQEIIYLIEQISFEKEWPHQEARLIEQTSFSYYLQQQTAPLLAMDDYLVHYWFLKEVRYILGNYFNFFYTGDQQQFIRLLGSKGLHVNHFSGLPYPVLPSLIIQLMKQFDLLREYHFESIPPHTFLGKILRDPDYQFEKNN